MDPYHVLWIRAPSLDFTLDGPIRLGNIIIGRRRPQHPIARLNFQKRTITSRSYEKNGTVDLSKTVYGKSQSQGEAQDSKSPPTLYNVDEIEGQFVSTRLAMTGFKELCKEDEVVRKTLNYGQVYVITGLQIAKGLKLSKEQIAEVGISLVDQDQVLPVTVGGSLKAESTGNYPRKYPNKRDCILAYRLIMIEKRRSRRLEEQSPETSALDPSKSDVMPDFEETGGEFEVEDLTSKEARYLFEAENKVLGT